MGSPPTAPHSGPALSPAQTNRKCQAVPPPTPPPPPAVGRLCLRLWCLNTSPASVGPQASQGSMTLDKTVSSWGLSFPLRSHRLRIRAMPSPGCGAYGRWLSSLKPTTPSVRWGTVHTAPAPSTDPRLHDPRQGCDRGGWPPERSPGPSGKDVLAS